MTDTQMVIMRLSLSHRKAKELRDRVPASEFLFSFKSSWFYRVPVSDVEVARKIGLTVRRGA